MNSRQRRELRRFIQRRLYEFVYERDYEGCMEFDLYPSKSKMYIDYPADKSDEIVYVKMPSFQILNRRAKEVDIEGTFTIKVSKDPRICSFREVSGLKELTPFSEEYIKTLHHARYPQFVLPIEDESEDTQAYLIREDYNGDISIAFYQNNSFEAGKSLTLEDLLNDTRISKKTRTELAFNIDLFGSKNESG